MASEQGPISASTTTLVGGQVEATSLSTAASTASSHIDPPAKSLKRSRPESSHEPSNFAVITNSSPPPISKVSKLGVSFSPRFSPAPLTGAAALADERRRKEEQQKPVSSSEMSENPSHKVLSSLIAGGGDSSMSRPQDAPVATTSMSGALSAVANAISIPSPKNLEEKSDTSPASVTSLTSLSSTAQTMTASTTSVTSPATILGPSEREMRREHLHASPEAAPSAADDKLSNRAFSYPGNVIAQAEAARGPARGMSLPMSGLNQQLAPRSPSQKKHRCPYCETEFTRHHNLKSHLLTHSQEKPYVCQTCQMRFRRLHDLKRHTKLHTGERPHICPKCDRKFARGDALARHAKGQGGCAGRRASMGSFGGDDDFEGSHGDDAMESIMYTEPEQTNEDMSEEDARRFSLPSIKTQHVQGQSGHEYSPQVRGPSTYPPAGPRQKQPSGGLYPPGAEHGSSSSGTSPSMQNGAGGHSPNTSISTVHSVGGVFSHSGMTESPKPLSPAGINSHQLGHDSGHINRQRSPSLTTQFQQAHFGRRDSSRGSPQMSLPSPHGPKLPALSGLAPPGLAPPGPSYTLPSQASVQQHPSNGLPPSPLQPVSGNQSYQPQMVGAHPGRSGLSGPPQHQHSSSGDSTSNNTYTPVDRGLLPYIQNLEEKVKQLSERVIILENAERMSEARINQLTDELRGQSRNQSQSGSIHMQQ